MKDIINKALEEVLRKKSVKATGFTKTERWTGKKHRINTYVATHAEFAAAAALNEMGMNGGWNVIPCEVSSKLSSSQKKDMQYQGYDLAMYQGEDGKLQRLGSTTPEYGIDVKCQHKASKYNSVNLEVYTLKNGGTKCWDTWLWNNKAPLICYVIQNDVYILHLSDLQDYARNNIDNAIRNSYSAQAQDEGYTHNAKYTIKLPLDTIRSLAVKHTSLLPSSLHLLKRRVPTIAKHNEWYDEEDFKWIDEAITRAEAVHPGK